MLLTSGLYRAVGLEEAAGRGQSVRMGRGTVPQDPTGASSLGFKPRIAISPSPLSHEIQVKEPTLLWQHHKAAEKELPSEQLSSQTKSLSLGEAASAASDTWKELRDAAQGGVRVCPGSGMLRDGMEWDGEVLRAPGLRKAPRKSQPSFGVSSSHTQLGTELPPALGAPGRNLTSGNSAEQAGRGSVPGNGSRE